MVCKKFHPRKFYRRILHPENSIQESFTHVNFYPRKFQPQIMNGNKAYNKFNKILFYCFIFQTTKIVPGFKDEVKKLRLNNYFFIVFNLKLSVMKVMCNAFQKLHDSSPRGFSVSCLVLCFFVFDSSPLRTCNNFVYVRDSSLCNAVQSFHKFGCILVIDTLSAL